MIIEKQKFGFRSARVILNDEELRHAIVSKRFSYVTGISYHKMQWDHTLAVKEKKTITISLIPKAEDILGGFTPSARNEVRRTYDDDKFTIVPDDKNFGEVYLLYSTFEREQGRVPFDKKSIFAGCKAFSVYYERELVSGIICYDAYPYLRSRANFSKRLATSDNNKKRIIGRASKRLIYEICLYGHERGYELFDHGSVNFDDKEKSGIREFKSSFGGEIVPEYTYTYKSGVFRFLYGLLRPFHNIA